MTADVTPTATRPRAWLSRRRKLLLAMLPLLLLLLLGELIARVVRAPLHFGSYRELRVDLMARLPGDPRRHARLRAQARLRGRRQSMGHAGDDRRRWLPQQQPVAVAVGPAGGCGRRSFACAEVADGATWPAHLERILGQPVCNAGVFGYSMAQAVLRAEAVLERKKAAWLVVSVFTDDIGRCEFSKRYASVPWFDVQDGALVLRNVPVQDASDPEDLRQRVQDAIGHSALVDTVCARICRSGGSRTRRPCARIRRARGARSRGCSSAHRRILPAARRGAAVGAAGSSRRRTPTTCSPTRAVRACGRWTIVLLQEAERADPTARARLFAGHMTDAGNRWAAEHRRGVARALMAAGRLDARSSAWLARRNRT
jgi:hypothetical protein